MEKNVDVSQDVAVRSVTADDIEKLEHAYPSPGVSAFHLDRFQMQQAHAADYLIAVFGDQVVGYGLIRFDGPTYPELKGVLPRTGEICAVFVHEKWRSHGVGGMLLAQFEKVARQANYEMTGMGVVKSNKLAKRFYEKRGYKKVKARKLINRYEVTLDDYTVHQVEEPINYFVKSLWK